MGRRTLMRASRGPRRVRAVMHHTDAPEKHVCRVRFLFPVFSFGYKYKASKHFPRRSQELFNTTSTGTRKRNRTS